MKAHLLALAEYSKFQLNENHFEFMGWDLIMDSDQKVNINVELGVVIGSQPEPWDAKCVSDY